MFIPNPLPQGPHYTYVFKVAEKSYFKIGLTRDPVSRRKAIQTRRLRLAEYARWRFDNYFAALYVEQQIISYLKRFGFAPSGLSDDWFEIDETTMKVVIEVVNELAEHIKSWEKTNWELDCIPKAGTPYHVRLTTDIQERRFQIPHCPS
jgi:hypothetical protein